MSLPASPPPQRATPIAAALALALLLHALLLGLVPLGSGLGLDEGVKPVMQARQIVLAPVAAAPPPPPPAAPRAAPARKAPAKLLSAATDPAITAPQPEAPAPIEPTPRIESVDAVPALAELLAPIDPAASAPALADASGMTVPTFATRLPPAVVMRFELRRGALTGDGELVWRPRPDGYTMAMNATAFSIPLITWGSEGLLDSDGLAPERFIDRRRARDVRSANFQREAGKISFSGPAIEYPLLPGAQDRLSWMVQLPAIVAAAPASFTAGMRIPIFVVGARGDADVWTFVVEDIEAVEVVGGRVDNALRLLREPRKPFDTRVEIWLDPARHHLPVRLKLTLAQTGEGNEFVLRQMSFLP